MPSFAKTFTVFSLDEAHALRKDMGTTPPPTPAGAKIRPPSLAQRPSNPAQPVKQPESRRRPEKPTIKMKPISNDEAAANLRAGKFYEKSIFEIIDMLKALQAMPPAPGKPYLPGVHLKLNKKPKAAAAKPPTMAKADFTPDINKPDLVKKKTKKASC